MTSNPHINKLLVYLNMTVLIIGIIVGLVFLYQHMNIFEEISHLTGLQQYDITEDEKDDNTRALIIEKLDKIIDEITNNKTQRG